MKQEQLVHVIAEELEHIPRSVKGSAQNELRLVYNRRRRVDLGRDPATPRRQSLKRAIQVVAASNPGSYPDYDKEFFDG